MFTVGNICDETVSGNLEVEIMSDKLLAEVLIKLIVAASEECVHSSQ